MAEKRILTDEQALKLLLDQKWRINNLYKIRTKVPGYEGETVKFTPNRVQKEIYQAIEDGKRRIIILKPRKLGVTTAVVLYLLDKAMYSPNQMCRTIAHRKQTVTELFNDIVRFAFDRIPEQIRIKERYSTRAEIDIAELGSKFSVDVEARGLTPTFLHLSEVAYVDDEAKLQDTLESLPMTACGIAESTANGKGNWFERTFMQNWELLQRGEKPEWYPMFFSWFQDPTNALPWLDDTRLFYEHEARELQARFNLKNEQILWWDRKKFQLGERMPELYPSTPEEAFIFSTGKVYPDFSSGLHVIKPTKYQTFKVAMDYGQTNPMVFLFFHQDEDGNFICFREFYRRECPIKEAVDWLKSHGVTHIDYADPSIFNNTQVSAVYHPGEDHRYSIADEFRRHGIQIRRGAQNDVLSGIVRVKEYLKYDPEHPHPFRKKQDGGILKGSPRLFITEDCVDTIKEFSLYRWPKDQAGSLNQSAYETPMKKDDHAMDCVRYTLLSWGKSLSEVEEKVDPRTPLGLLQRIKNGRHPQSYQAY
jgi:hypothetical protein